MTTHGNLKNFRFIRLMAGWTFLLVFSAAAARAQSPDSLKITAYEMSGNAFSLSWTGTGGSPAIVQRSTTLLEGSWVNLSGYNASGSFTDWNPPGNRVFYRVALPGVLSPADQLAMSASATIQADLQQEIIENSDAVDTGGGTVYSPHAAANMAVQRSVFTLDTDPDFANLVKQSGRGNLSGVQVFNFLTPDNSSDPGAQPVSPARWSAPMLAGRDFDAAQTPHWIYVTPAGYSPVVGPDTTGRIAFNVYDVGGLLNINASGFAPATGTTAFSDEMHRKGSTVWADLRALPGISPSAFASNDAWPPQWRMPGDWGSGANGFSLFPTSPDPSGPYYERTGWRAAFIDPGGNFTDRMFASRQGLITYAKANPGTFTSNGNLVAALPYLTHWSRWNNAPSFKHDETRTYTLPVVGNVAAGGNDYYNATARAAANPFFPTVRVATAFQRKTIDAAGNLVDRSATTGLANVGDALVKYRFPLNRIGMVKRTTVEVDVNHPIYWAFGLTRSNNVSDPWVYSALSTSQRICTLAEVATQGREPNFFELLKAAIHAGSLGKASGAGATISRDGLDGNLDLQVWRLGANLIDQYDADSFPTIIRLPAGTLWDDTNYISSGTMKVKIYGIENLPQVQAVMQVWKWTSKKNASSTPVGATIIMQPVLWNPHDITTYADPGSGAPTKFRVWASASSLQYNSEAASTANPNRSNSAVEFDANPAAFREPNLIAREARDGINALAVGTLASITDDTPLKWLGSGRTEPAGGYAVPGVYPSYYAANSANGLSVYLDYQDTDGTWVTYSALESMIHNGFIGFYSGYMTYFAKPDPRTQRFGSFASQTGVPNSTSASMNAYAGAWGYIGTGWPPTSGQMASLWDLPPRGPVWCNWGQFNGRGESGASTNPTGMTMNTDASAPPGASAFRYTDPDGVLRWGDSGFGANGMLSNETATRPIILNRPFRSVGEMGYAFRDLPWKSLDFFSERSGDSALLDVFCISESPDDGVVANRVSLNSASDEVLHALLKEGLRRDAGGADGSSVSADWFSDAELTTIVAAIRTTRNAAPFLNRSELVSRVMAALPATGTSFTIKREREAVIRALADMVETNNWNLMVDVIAQTGHMPPGASSPADFIPDGESRRWNFISINRTTATLVDQVGEDVAE